MVGIRGRRLPQTPREGENSRIAGPGWGRWASDGCGGSAGRRGAPRPRPWGGWGGGAALGAPRSVRCSPQTSRCPQPRRGAGVMLRAEGAGGRAWRRGMEVRGCARALWVVPRPSGPGCGLSPRHLPRPNPRRAQPAAGPPEDAGSGAGRGRPPAPGVTSGRGVTESDGLRGPKGDRWRGAVRDCPPPPPAGDGPPRSPRPAPGMGAPAASAPRPAGGVPRPGPAPARRLSITARLRPIGAPRSPLR